MSETDEIPIRRLLGVARTLVSDLDAASILDRVLEAARVASGARYAALGVLDESRTELAAFHTSGIEPAARDAIGPEPRGRGVLGLLITDPRPIRLADVGAHPLSYGFPERHPKMGSFLGVPITVRDEIWGNLYLTEKEGGAEFTEEDEDMAVLVAEWAAAAIDNARLYGASERRRIELERAVRGLEATRDIAIAIGEVIALDHVLELIAKRGRALVEARALLVALVDGDELVVAAAAGDAADAVGRRVPRAGSAFGRVLVSGHTERIADVGARLGLSADGLGLPDARTALLAPLRSHGEPVGVLVAFDHGPAAEPFEDADEQLVATFAATAANAVTMARLVESDRSRSALAAADAERGRWARELHDETLQIFGGLRVLLSGAMRRKDPSRYEAAMREAVSGIELGIEGLRAIITDLRPAALDELGLAPAIEGLLDRRRRGGLEIVAEVDLAGAGALHPELETTVYRLLQESLTNISKHAQATRVAVSVRSGPDAILLQVRDDGVGFDVSDRPAGFGLAGMRERVRLAGGTLELDSSSAGTVVEIVLPRTSADSATSRRPA